MAFFSYSGRDSKVKDKECDLSIALTVHNCLIKSFFLRIESPLNLFQDYYSKHRTSSLMLFDFPSGSCACDKSKFISNIFKEGRKIPPPPTPIQPTELLAEYINRHHLIM